MVPPQNQAVDINITFQGIHASLRTQHLKVPPKYTLKQTSTLVQNTHKQTLRLTHYVTFCIAIIIDMKVKAF